MRTRTKVVWVMAALAMLICVGTFLLLFTGPYRYMDRDLRPLAIQHLRDGASKKVSWAASPVDSAREYLYSGSEIDPLNSRYVWTKVSSSSQTEVIVSVFDSSSDDSVFLTCDRLTMRLENDAWIPIT